MLLKIKYKNVTGDLIEIEDIGLIIWNVAYEKSTKIDC